MSAITMKQLLEAGVHFGHQTKKWNPKMKKYIFDARNDVHIINLEQTAEAIETAYAFIRDIVARGKSVLFVGKKKQAKEAIMQEATRCGMFYINQRWLGGTLTNFATIRSRVDRLNKLNQMEIIGEFDILPKKEVIKLKKERDTLENNLGGIKNMRELPGALFVVDLKVEHLAVREARHLGIPIVGLVDTNCDPEEVDYVIPGNDDAIRAIKLIAGVIADAVIEAKEGEQGTAGEEILIETKAGTDGEETVAKPENASYESTDEKVGAPEAKESVIIVEKKPKIVKKADEKKDEPVGETVEKKAAAKKTVSKKTDQPTAENDEKKVKSVQKEAKTQTDTPEKIVKEKAPEKKAESDEKARTNETTVTEPIEKSDTAGRQ